MIIHVYVPSLYILGEKKILNSKVIYFKKNP